MAAHSLPRRHTLSDYESQALDAIREWRYPDESWLARTSHSFQAGLNSITNQIRRIPGVDWTIENIVSGLITLTNEIAHDLVWRESIFESFRKAGYENVQSLEDIAYLDLEAIDTVSKNLPLKYNSLAAVEGAATGVAGAAGILPDIVALLGINLRAAGEYATFCGFDITDPAERLYALHILDAASKPKDQVPYSMPKHLPHASKILARKKTLNTVEQFAVSGTAKRIARSLALRLTRDKMAQFLPVAGAVVAGGFNGLYTNTVCNAAYHLYRERFLERKYGL